jgi:hypothetical protein
MYAKRRRVERRPSFVLLNALVGGSLLILICEQEELVLGVDAAMSGGLLGGLDAIKIMAKLAGNLAVVIRMYDV